MTTATHDTTAPDATTGPNRLLDFIVEKMGLKNDAALCRVLGVAPPVVSKIRHHKLPVTARLMIKIHKISDLSIREIEAFLGMDTQ